MNQDAEEFILEHYGTMGMKWGVRKEARQERRQVKREGKAQKFVKKANEFDTRIKEIGTDTKGVKNLLVRRELRDITEKRDRALDDASRKREGKLSKRQKKVAIGASAAAVIVGSAITYQALQSGNARRLVGKGKDFVLRKQGLPWKVNPELRDPNLDVDGIMEKVVGHINPNYGAAGTKNNCRRATFAYEMRRRGYDVAATRTGSGRGQDASGLFNVTRPNINLVPAGKGAVARIFSEARGANKYGKAKPFTEAIANPDFNFGEKIAKGESVASKIRGLIAVHPDGARGEFGMEWIGGGGHSMAWEKVKDRVVIFDTQTGKKYETPDELEDLGSRIARAGITRLDNIPLNDDFLRRWVKDA